MGQIQIMALLTMATEFCMQGEVERGGRRGGGGGLKKRASCALQGIYHNVRAARSFAS